MMQLHLEQRDDKLQAGSSKSICEIFSKKYVFKRRLCSPMEVLPLKEGLNLRVKV